LKTIGLAITNKLPDPEVVEVIKEVESKKKSVMGGFLEFNSKPLTDETTVSSKVLAANEGWVYKNNDVIAQEVAGIEFELFSIRVVGKEIIYDPILQHPILDILDRFNEFTAASDGFYITQSHRKLAGDCFWYLDGEGINIKNIFILPPDKVDIELGDAKGTQRIIKSYEYRDTIKGKPIEAIYKPEDIIHFKVPNPANYYRGKSTVEAAAKAIDTDTMAIEANMKLFERGLIANFMLSTDKSLTPEQLKQLHTEFRNTYGGVKNAYKVPILGGGLKSENLQMSNRDAQYLEQQEWLRDKICSLFGNPKSIITTDDVNRANAGETILNWKRTTIRSNMKGITDTLNEFLVPRYGTNLILGFKDPVEEDETAKVDLVVLKKNAGIVNLNEAREELGLEPVDGGDEFTHQREERIAERANQFERDVPKALKFVRRKQIIRNSGAYKQIEEFIKIKEAAKPLAKDIIAKKKAAIPKAGHKSFSAEKAEKYYFKQIAIVEAAEKIFEDKVVSFINRTVDKALAQVPAEIQDMKDKALYDVNDLTTQAVIDFTPILMELAAQSGTEALNLINSDKPYIPTNVRKEVESQVKLFAQSMVETDRDKIIDMITNGISNGQSIPDISNAIRNEFDSFSKMQAERITRTEVLKTSNISAVDAWGQSGVVVGKQWLTAPNPDAECAIYADKIVSLKGNFYDTSKFANGDPPVHPNCRCTILPVLTGERANKVTLHNKKIEEELAEAKQYISELEEVVNEEA
jgi:HK97 family phage portal protein